MKNKSFPQTASNRNALCIQHLFIKVYLNLFFKEMEVRFSDLYYTQVTKISDKKSHRKK